MLYDGFAKTINDRVLSELDTIASEHNFELGEEFEIAICRVLRKVLPVKYGICRGYVVSKDGQKCGDDIIIFDVARYPTLLFRDRDDFSRKENIPIEAVFGYIEAKYTLNIQGNCGQSLQKAIAQTQAVKRLVNTRESVKLGTIRGVDLGNNKFASPDSYPDYWNPSWCGIFVGRLRTKKGGELIESYDKFKDSINSLDLLSPDDHPDMLVLGRDIIISPSKSSGEDNIAEMSFFWIDDRFNHGVMNNTPGMAFGVGVIALLAAIDWIRLAPMPWTRIMADASGMETSFD